MGKHEKIQSSVRLRWQDYLIQYYGGNQLKAPIDEVLTTLIRARKNNQVFPDPVLNYSALAFREILTKNEFTWASHTSISHKEEERQTSQESRTEEFDLDKFMMQLDSGSVAIQQVEKGFSENTEMIEAYQKSGNRDDSTYANIFTANQGLIFKIANAYQGMAFKMGLSIEDLVGYGNEGLVKAIEKFDPKLGYSFSTYSTAWIRQSINRHMYDEGPIVRLPIHLVETINKLHRVERDIEKKFGRANSGEVCKELGITKDRYLQLKQIRQQFGQMVSLNQIVGQAPEGDTEIGALVTEDGLGLMGSEVDPEIDVMNKDVITRLCRLLDDQLKPKQAEILKLRFGMVDGVPHTLEEIGKIYGLTRERIRQIQDKSLQRLRKLVLIQGREDYVVEED